MNPEFPVSIIRCESEGEFFASQSLNPGEVSAFLLEHDEQVNDDALESLGQWSDDDHERMRDFRDQRGKTSWCMARRVFRSVMLRVLGMDAESMTMETGEFGKPFFRNSPITFNWAHTTGCFLLAVSNQLKVGCDIEDSHRRRETFRDIARDYFGIAEQRWIDDSSTAEEAWLRFLATFVEKEARLKMSGNGITESMRSTTTAMRLPPYYTGTVFSFRTPEVTHDLTGGRYFAAMSFQSEPHAISIRTHRFAINR